MFWDDTNDSKEEAQRKSITKASLFKKAQSPPVHPSQMGSFVCVVKDNGHGISSENLTNLFKEGMQFKANQLQGGGGSGLGLWISKGIVDMHGGSLVAHSDGEGKGCTFTMRIPAFDSENPHFASFNAEISKLTAIHSDVSDDILHLQIILTAAKIKKILVVDDISSSRKIVCRLLKVTGCDSVEAVNGQDAIDKLADPSIFPTPPDLILMDYEMPVYVNSQITCFNTRVV